MKIEFVSYDGDYPFLCGGTLILSIDGKEIVFPKLCLSSGGSYDTHRILTGKIKKGSWRIRQFPKGFPKELKKEARRLVNEHVSHGCCGGCL